MSRKFRVQYHPEVVHSERGIETLRRFLTGIAGLSGDWTMQSVIDAEKKVIADKVGPDAHVICALSGGVDSTVAATLVHSVRPSSEVATNTDVAILQATCAAQRQPRKYLRGETSGYVCRSLGRGCIACLWTMAC